MSSDRNDPSMASAAASAMGVGVKVGEIAVASGVVVGARMWMIGAAMSNPFLGDYRELGRMVPEKIVAFAQSGLALLDGVNTARREVMAQMAETENVIAGGVPAPAALLELAAATGRRGTRAMMWPLVTGDAALAPLHRTVTANARRLGKGGPKAARDSYAG